MASDNYQLSKKAGVINPYTFVPIDNKNVLRQNVEAYYKEKELHTGVLDCILKVKTPLAIPDVEKVEVKEYEHKEYPFYKIGNQYAIPGSTLRGAIRSMFETVTNSCFSTLKINTFLSERNKNPYQPGILKCVNGHYVLYKAKRYLVPIQGYADIQGYRNSRFKVCICDGVRKIELKNGTYLCSGDIVNFKSIVYKKRDFIIELYSEGNGNRSGILYIGEPTNKKHSESVFTFEDVEGQFTSEMLKQAYLRLKDTLKIYQDKAINKNLEEKSKKKRHNGYAGFERISLDIGLPLWYQIDKGGKIHFSYASIGRSMYQKTLNDLVGQLDSCTSRKNLCEACMLFGMVGGSGDESQGIGSRVRVTDAFIHGETLPDTNNVTLKEQGAPRYSYLPFYAKIPVQAGKKRKIPTSYDADKIQIAGRKYYWHHKNLMQDNTKETFKTSERNNRNSTMELIPPEIEFSFKIYYDRISEEQLQKLIWTITLGENSEDSQQCYKIGHGKPLGLGSVKLTVEKCWERIMDADGYHIETIPIKIQKMNYDKNILVALEKVLNTEVILQRKNQNYKIDYPNIVDEQGREIPLEVQKKNNNQARHQWYSQNRKVTNSKKEDTVQTLPDIMAETQVLMQYQYLGKNDYNGAKYSSSRKK